MALASDPFRGKHMIIIGDLGFMGWNMTRCVTQIYSLISESRGSLSNIARFQDRLGVDISDVRGNRSIRCPVPGQDCLFDLAGQTSHLDLMQNSCTSLESNCRASRMRY